MEGNMLPTTTGVFPPLHEETVAAYVLKGLQNRIVPPQLKHILRRKSSTQYTVKGTKRSQDKIGHSSLKPN